MQKVVLNLSRARCPELCALMTVPWLVDFIVCFACVQIPSIRDTQVRVRSKSFLFSLFRDTIVRPYENDQNHFVFYFRG